MVAPARSTPAHSEAGLSPVAPSQEVAEQAHERCTADVEACIEQLEDALNMLDTCSEEDMENDQPCSSTVESDVFHEIQSILDALQEE